MTTLNKMAGILRIAEKYAEGEDILWPGADHDIIYLPLPLEGISIADTEDLKKLGAFVDGDTDCWAVYT